MSQFGDCAEKIYNIIANSSYDYRFHTENTLEEVFDTMLIFINYEDLVEIVKKRVYPKVWKLVHSPNDTHWVTYLERKIKEWESFYS
jgi:hypothetical protein